MVVRKRNAVGRHHEADRREAEQIGLDRQHIVADQERIGGVGEHRIEPLPGLADAFVHRSEKIVVGPGADASFPVGCQIGRIDRSERQLEGDAAYERLAVLNRVTGKAGAGAGKTETMAARGVRELKRANEKGQVSALTLPDPPHQLFNRDRRKIDANKL